VTAKKAAASAKHKPATKKHAASAKHTQTKAQAAHLHTLHVEHVAHLAHLKATGQKVTVKAKPTAHAKAKKKVGFAVGDWLPVCGFEAVAQSLRLAGQRVHGDDVAGLWELCGAAEATTIEDALAAAARFGLAGCRPVAYDLHSRYGDCGLDQLAGDDADLAPFAVEAQALPPVLREAFLHRTVGQAVQPHGLILRIDVPGPHAVLATRDGWWSWGELYSPWPARVSEAWAVSWS
jgi:hypothetical protein